METAYVNTVAEGNCANAAQIMVAPLYFGGKGVLGEQKSCLVSPMSFYLREKQVSPISLDDSASDCSTGVGSPDNESRHEEGSNAESSTPGSENGVASLFIFDWDDTLFPTSWMHEQGIQVMTKPVAPLSHEQEACFLEMAEQARLTLQKAMQFGKVIIVTNAEQGWVERSCIRFMPSLVSLLKTVDIVSARSAHELRSRSPGEWKRRAFADELDRFSETLGIDQHYNFVSVGDALYEARALKAVTEGMPRCFGKSVKLQEEPSVEKLIEQHDFLRGCLSEVVEHNGDLDVEIGALN